jgi:hypothetical protein
VFCPDGSARHVTSPRRSSLYSPTHRVSVACRCPSTCCPMSAVLSSRLARNFVFGLAVFVRITRLQPIPHNYRSPVVVQTASGCKQARDTCSALHAILACCVVRVS